MKTSKLAGWISALSTKERTGLKVSQEHLPQWNQGFRVVPAGPSDAHRPLRAERELAAILSHPVAYPAPAGRHASQRARWV